MQSADFELFNNASLDLFKVASLLYLSSFKLNDYNICRYAVYKSKSDTEQPRSVLAKKILGGQRLFCPKIGCRVIRSTQENFEIFTSKSHFLHSAPRRLLQNLAVKKTNFTLLYKLPECFSGNCPKTSISVKIGRGWEAVTPLPRTRMEQP